MFIWGIIWFIYLRCTFENSSIGALETHESFFSSIQNFLWFYFFWRWKKCCTPHFLNSSCFLDSPLLVVDISSNMFVFVYGHIHFHSLGKWEMDLVLPHPQIGCPPPPPYLGNGIKTRPLHSLCAIHVRQQANTKSLPAMRSQLIPHPCGRWLYIHRRPGEYL